MAQKKKTQKGRLSAVRSNELLSCALYHDRHAKEPLNVFDARVFKLNPEEKKTLAETHLRWARAIRSLLSAR